MVDYVKEVTNLDIKEQLGKILSFDMLILNGDRHFNNLGILADTAHEEYRNAPVFDNGNSLLSNIGEYPFEEPLEENIEKVIGQPFCANLERQAWELGYGLKINYNKLYHLLSNEPDSRAMEVLQFQLERYEEVLRDDSLLKENKESVLAKLKDNKSLCEAKTKEGISRNKSYIER